jgi:GH15 family glucan-1,4-alpha-glucosidase
VEAEPRYWPIKQYGVIGDCRTAALVAPNGSIDWMCLPHFDSPAILCKLLDAEKGGSFRVAPRGQANSSMTYLPETNILETTFQTDDGRLRLVDFMPIRKRARGNVGRLAGALISRAAHGAGSHLEREAGNDVAAAHRVSRMATCLDGQVTTEITLKPTFDYARRSYTFELHHLSDDVVGALLTAGDQRLVFIARRLRTESTPADAESLVLHCDQEQLHLRVPMSSGHGLVTAAQYARSAEEARDLLGMLAEHSFQDDLEETLAYWREWSAQCRYDGTYQYAVLRSALALKLCTFEPTGAIVAAPTTSLPEGIGGVRNWDYRYTWLRDSSFTLDALERLGYSNEARDYFHFVHDLQIKSGADLRIMYGILGESDGRLEEQTLDHLEGYRGSRPVRIGNGACTQRQLDIYGELLDCAYRYVTRGGFHRELPHRPVHDLRHLAILVADYVAEHWRDTDRGIWEVRGEPRPFVYSRAMCWVAMDRAIELAKHHGHERHVRRWAKARDAIHADVLEHGYDQRLATFVQSYGSNVLDAANMRLPLAGFLPWDDARIKSTIENTDRVLSADHALVYRYRTDTQGEQAGAMTTADAGADDGLPGPEGAFLACAFWLVDTLCHLGRVEEARGRFEQLLAYAGPLGLFSEEADPTTGDLLGNYPQAFTHIGLINCAVTLQMAQEGALNPS